AASTCARPLQLFAARRVLRRTNHYYLCTTLTTGRICRMAACRPHDSTPALDDGCASSDSLGCAIPATLVRVASSSFDQRSRSVSIVEAHSQGGAFRIAPLLLLVSFYFG